MYSRLIVLFVFIGFAEYNHALADEPFTPAFAFMRGGKVWVMDEEGKQQKPIARELRYSANRPICWSPFGSDVYYWNHSKIGWDIWRVDLQTKKTKNITNVKKGGCRCPSPSPDGKLIAFMRDYEAGVYVMKADGSNQRRVSTHGHRDVSPTWSPDGKMLAYLDLKSIANNRVRTMIYVVNFDGSNDRLLTESADDPQWSKDGKSILCSASRNKKWNIHLIDPKTGKETNLTNSPHFEASPKWSPDGDKIAFLRRVDKKYELHMMQKDGKADTKIVTFEDRRYTFFTWSPDSSRIAFTNGKKGAEKTYIATLNNKIEIRKIADGRMEYLSWRPRRK